MNITIKRMLALAILFPVFAALGNGRMSADERHYWDLYKKYYATKLIIVKAQERCECLRKKQPNDWERRIVALNAIILAQQTDLAQIKLQIMDYFPTLDQKHQDLWVNKEKIC